MNPAADIPPRRDKPVLVYLVTEDWYFMSHRVPMAQAARDAGYEVHVVTQVDKDGGAIEALGFHLHAMAWRRGSVSPFAFLAEHSRGAARLPRACARSRASRRLAADHCRLACRRGPAVRAGERARRARLCIHLRRAEGAAGASPVARLAALRARPRARDGVWCKTPTTARRCAASASPIEAITVIAGSGVETDRLTPLPEPDGDVTVGFVGRLLDDKGLRALIAAQEILARRGQAVRLLIAGEPDPANPASIPPQEIAAWARRPGIDVLGHVADIRDVWKAAHIAVLPSRREGLPKSLLEAAACGRAIVATDVPGCREIARPGVNALLVPVDDAPALADAIARLANDGALRRKFGAAGRQLVEAEFSAAQVGKQTVALYDRLMARP